MLEKPLCRSQRSPNFEGEVPAPPLALQQLREEVRPRQRLDLGSHAGESDQRRGYWIYCSCFYCAVQTKPSPGIFRAVRPRDVLGWSVNISGETFVLRELRIALCRVGNGVIVLFTSGAQAEPR